MNTALIMAGGTGIRMNHSRKKQFILIKEKPILQYTLEKFLSHPEINKIVLVVPEDELESAKTLCSALQAGGIIITAGGLTRQQSVYNGLQVCPSGTKYVMIHDGVRPFIKGELITELLQQVQVYQAVIPASRVRNTLKEVQGGVIVRTLEREKLYNAQTPQVFSYELIRQCHQKVQSLAHQFTDDSSLLEYFSYPVRILETDDSNFKITEPFDLELARHLL